MSNKNEVKSFSSKSNQKTSHTTPIKSSQTISFCGITSPKSDISMGYLKDMTHKSQFSKTSLINLKESINELKGQSVEIRQYLTTITI